MGRGGEKISGNIKMFNRKYLLPCLLSSGKGYNFDITQQILSLFRGSKIDGWSYILYYEAHSTSLPICGTARKEEKNVLLVVVL